MRGEWCYFKSHFSPEQCKRILDDGLMLPAQDAKLGVDGSVTANNYRKSKIRFIQKDDPNFNGYLMKCGKWQFKPMMNGSDFIFQK